MPGDLSGLKQRIQQRIASLAYRLSGELCEGTTTDYVAGRLPEFRQELIGLERMLDELRCNYQCSRRDDREDLYNATSIAVVKANQLVKHCIYRHEHTPILPGPYELPYLATEPGIGNARTTLRNLRAGVKMLPVEV